VCAGDRELPSQTADYPFRLIQYSTFQTATMDNLELIAGF
jgi:hypothetical protein